MLARICACLLIERLGARQSRVERFLRLCVCPLNRTWRWLMAQLGTNRLGHWARDRVLCRLTYSLLELCNLFGARPRVSQQSKWAQSGTNHESRCNSPIVPRTRKNSELWTRAASTRSLDETNLSMFAIFHDLNRSKRVLQAAQPSRQQRVMKSNHRRIECDACEALSLGFFVCEKGRQLQLWCQPPGWNGIPGCPALAGSGVSTSRLMTTGSCPLLTTTASQISFGLPLIS
jgi:hypothetical protein